VTDDRLPGYDSWLDNHGNPGLAEEANLELEAIQEEYPYGSDEELAETFPEEDQ